MEQGQAVPQPRKRRKVLGVALVLGLAMAVAVVAFGAANIVEDSILGIGTGNVTGIHVTDVHWVPTAADPEQVNQVTFSTVGDTSAVAVSIKVDGGAFVACQDAFGAPSPGVFNGGTGNTDYDCYFATVNVEAVDTFTVEAVG